MNVILPDINAISNLTLQVMQSVIAKNDQVKVFEDQENGPVALASALSDFFEICTVLESGQQQLDSEQINEFGDYGLHLLDGLAMMVRRLEIMDQRENIARINASLTLWLVRRNATLENLEGAADSFAYLTNGLNSQDELESMCHLMGEVIQSVSEDKAMDTDTSDPWRPWRVLNLNAGIAATRSLNPKLMEETFEALGRRLPYDMPGFFADGRRRILTQNVPDEVVEVLNRYADKWPEKASH